MKSRLEVFETKSTKLLLIQRFLRAGVVAIVLTSNATTAYTGQNGQGAWLGSIKNYPGQSGDMNNYFYARCHGQGGGHFDVQIIHLQGQSALGAAETLVSETGGGSRGYWSGDGRVSPEDALRNACPDPAPQRVAVEESKRTVEECKSLKAHDAVACLLQGNYFIIAGKFMEEANQLRT